MYADPDQSVRTGAQHLDKLLRDVISVIPVDQTINIADAVTLIASSVYVNDAAVRQLTISWISLLMKGMYGVMLLIEGVTISTFTGLIITFRSVWIGGVFDAW